MFRPFQQIMRKHTVQPRTISKCESGPQAGRFGAALEERMSVKQIGLRVVRHEAESFHVAVRDTHQISSGSDDFRVRIL